MIIWPEHTRIYPRNNIRAGFWSDSALSNPGFEVQHFTRWSGSSTHQWIWWCSSGSLLLFIVSLRYEIVQRCKSRPFLGRRWVSSDWGLGVLGDPAPFINRTPDKPQWRILDPATSSIRSLQKKKVQYYRCCFFFRCTKLSQLRLIFFSNLSGSRSQLQFAQIRYYDIRHGHIWTILYHIMTVLIKSIIFLQRNSFGNGQNGKWLAILLFLKSMMIQ